MHPFFLHGIISHTNCIWFHQIINGVYIMRVLLGTTNPSKVERFKKLLAGCNVEFLTLKDLDIRDEPIEQGQTPEANARIKARFYSRYFDTVICNDSGLYFDEIHFYDPRQPGLNIRTPLGTDHRLDDEEMIAHYSKLVKEMGGKVHAFYVDGMAVYHKGKFYSFMDAELSMQIGAFYMVDTPSPLRHPGWPLDSLSLRLEDGGYFVEKRKDMPAQTQENIMLGAYRDRLSAFLKSALGLEEPLRLVKAGPEYRHLLCDMMDEWTGAEEDITPWAIVRSDYHHFDTWLQSLEVKQPTEKAVPDSTFFCLDAARNRMVGAVNIRHFLNERLLKNGGHIGDGVRPSERGRGIGTKMIGLALDECRKLGIEKVLMVCDKDNIASARTIRKNGGVLENEITVDGIIEQRYWITL